MIIFDLRGMLWLWFQERNSKCKLSFLTDRLDSMPLADINLKKSIVKRVRIFCTIEKTVVRTTKMHRNKSCWYLLVSTSLDEIKWIPIPLIIKTKSYIFAQKKRMVNKTSISRKKEKPIKSFGCVTSSRWFEVPLHSHYEQEKKNFFFISFIDFIQEWLILTLLLKLL